MKKYLVLLMIFSMIFVTGCGKKKTPEQKEAEKIKKEVIKYKNNFKVHKNKFFELSDEVAGYLKNIKDDEVICKLTPEGIALCFAKYMAPENTVKKNIIKTGDSEWEFLIKEKCKNLGECKIIITDSYYDKYVVDLISGEGGYLTLFQYEAED